MTKEEWDAEIDAFRKRDPVKYQKIVDSVAPMKKIGDKAIRSMDRCLWVTGIGFVLLAIEIVTGYKLR